MKIRTHKHQDAIRFPLPGFSYLFVLLFGFRKVN